MQQKLNRRKAPVLSTFTDFRIKSPEQYSLGNGIPTTLFNMGAQDVAMVKLLFPAGSWHETLPQEGYLTNRMLLEGTKNYNSAGLSNAIEFYGASVELKAKNNHAEVVLYTLTKHLGALLPLLKEMITAATFPEKELQTIVQNTKRHLLVQKEKVEVIADDVFKAKLFGETHPYSYPIRTEDFDALTVERLNSFYKKHYSSENCAIYLAGKFSDADLKSIETHFGGNDWQNGQRVADIEHSFAPFVPGQHFIAKKDAVQAALRIGYPLFNKTHPDYQALFVLNTLLGGFFGSRLMANIREEKGYTYGIYSVIHSFIKGGYFAIQTEVGNEVRHDALREILLEMDRLRNELVEDEELEIVRNYLLGTILMQLSGAFNIAAALQGVFVYGLGINFYHEFIETIRTITPQKLRDLAQQYLREEQMLQVIVHG